MAPLIVAIAVLVVLGLGITVWVFLPAFRGPEAARRDLGTHRLAIGAWHRLTAQSRRDRVHRPGKMRHSSEWRH